MPGPFWQEYETFSLFYNFVKAESTNITWRYYWILSYCLNKMGYVLLMLKLWVVTFSIIVEIYCRVFTYTSHINWDLRFHTYWLPQFLEKMLNYSVLISNETRFGPVKFEKFNFWDSKNFFKSCVRYIFASLFFV